MNADQPTGPLVTAIFPLFHASDKVDTLVRDLLSQRHERFARQSDWLQAIFIDNASTDDTVDRLRRTLERAADASHVEVVVNPENIGLARSLNRAFGMVKTPWALTCHVDCRFGSDRYIATMVDYLDRHPNAGAITGAPSIDPSRPLPLVEKVNMVANLMDIFPRDDAELIPVGFAEGRCDGFRMEALRRAGYYDTTLRLAGEDQILAARMRANGFEVYQAPKLTYFLSVSVQQDTARKLLAHQRRFGRAHPYILLHAPGSSAGVIGEKAGANRKRRLILRATQLLASMIYVFTVIALLAQANPAIWIAPLAAIVVTKVVLFHRHLSAIPFAGTESLRFWSLQPALDLSYSLGVLQGLWALRKRTSVREIK